VTKKHDQLKGAHNFCTTGTPENVSAMKHYLNQYILGFRDLPTVASVSQY
jgi:antitoxin component HigA of HigAB toxin-antitoxin module